MTSGEKMVGRSGVVRAPSASWNYDMTQCPASRKVLLLTDAGIAVIGHLAGGSRGYIAWSPLPDRDPDKEREMGVRR